MIATRQPRPRPAVSKAGDVNQLGAVGAALELAGKKSIAMPIASKNESETVHTTSVHDWDAAASTCIPMVEDSLSCRSTTTTAIRRTLTESL